MYNVSKLLFFDIETVSQYKDLCDIPKRELKMWQSYYDTFTNRVTDGAKLLQYKENTEEYINEVDRQTAAFFPEFGKVCCISLGFVTNGGDIRLQSFCGENEKDILLESRNVFNKIEKLGFELCGQNIKGFDIPFLGKRFFINGLKPPSIFPKHDTKPWEMAVLDTKDIWQFGSNRGLSSLDLITTILGIESPKNGDVRGDNVSHFYWDGELNSIKEYCEKDVKALIDIINTLNNLK